MGAKYRLIGVKKMPTKPTASSLLIELNVELL